MPKAQLRFSQGFNVTLTNKRAPIATMVLRTAASEADPTYKQRGRA